MTRRAGMRLIRPSRRLRAMPDQPTIVLPFIPLIRDRHLADARVWTCDDLGSPQDIPDLTDGGQWSANCGDVWTPDGIGSYGSDGWCCTRRSGHTGRHAAGTGERIAAVWL